VSRVALAVFLVFLFLAILRMARPLLHAGRARFGRSPAQPIEAEMVKDPVCGTWIDRRLAVLGRRGGATVPVCSENCRRRLESA
jgi:YHS domain-containing protein